MLLSKVRKLGKEITYTGIEGRKREIKNFSKIITRKAKVTRCFAIQIQFFSINEGTEHKFDVFISAEEFVRCTIYLYRGCI